MNISNERLEMIMITLEKMHNKDDLKRIIRDAAQHASDQLSSIGMTEKGLREITSPPKLKLRRNAVCFCGSGKKFKNCHMKRN
jgi:uncharacterized protein YchJ